ncbi:response regulator transcription factor [Clostridium oryzae]|uniref:Stage 0 sporulation protein A homolog n=1 Tax=Clostridium oryzae TaxID=1450648 RepID=A0A1V4J025_9CLOT|nr:response regulator [Clostridium oryzae]OPJ65017.1 putative response regulatory protein [Clostridium oryzae]
MYKALVVDDEHFIRLGIKAMLERYKESFYTVYTARNGVEALKLMEKEQIDLVITDIRMPDMDGMELIKNIYSFTNKPEMLILSGYDEFEYAANALRYGVRDYILKPIERTKFYDVLGNVEKILENKQNSKSKNLKLEECIKVFKKFQLGYLLLNNRLTDEERDIILKFVDISLLKSKFYISLIVRRDGKASEDTIFVVNSILEGKQSITPGDYIIFEDTCSNVVLLSKSGNAIMELDSYFRSHNTCKYFTVIYDSLIETSNVECTYKILRKMIYYKLVMQDINTLKYSDIQNKRKEEYKVPTEKINHIYTLLGSNRNEEMQRIVDEVLDYNAICNSDIGYLIDVFKELKHVLIDKIKEKYFYESEPKFSKYDKIGKLQNYSDLYEYYHDMKEYINYMNAYIEAIKGDYNDKICIYKALDYINQNYEKPINLTIVSNYVSMNYSYFSKLFKEHTGESFINYIRRIRMDKAKELLSQSSYKIYEVGERVGYEDTKQFTKAFRKFTSISPREYRQKYINE